ncbi:Tse2 family ADP-ribosyltransferase toxin [Vibrio diabolicus]|uniref:Tse2 family ADP-ribosyltransferase toxin n=1 Tax=Vibrio diabolicus TaxID=50719 RepID=UPI0037520338
MYREDLYFASEDLYRLGNATSPRLTNIRRPKDLDTIDINGILVAVSNGKGISLSTLSRMESSPMSGWVWKLSKGTQLPIGLKLINDRPGHYSLCPARNMPLDEFKGLLSKLAIKCQKVMKKQVI